MTIDDQATAASTETRAAGSTTSANRIPGEIGIWIFIFGDLAVFGLLFGMYVFYRGRQPTVFIDAPQSMPQSLGFANTVILLVSSLLVLIGMRAIRSGSEQTASRAIAGAITCGLAFAALKAVEWTIEATSGRTPYTNDFFNLYYTLTGLHLVHVVVGLGALMYILKTARLPTISGTRFATAESGACFWHMVDLLWIVIFPLFYLLS